MCTCERVVYTQCTHIPVCTRAHHARTHARTEGGREVRKEILYIHVPMYINTNVCLSAKLLYYMYTNSTYININTGTMYARTSCTCIHKRITKEFRFLRVLCFVCKKQQTDCAPAHVRVLIYVRVWLHTKHKLYLYIYIYIHRYT